MTLSVLSREYICVEVEAGLNGVSSDPTADTVVMALMATGNPSTGDWKTASWETSLGKYFARLEVGPGSTVGSKTAGKYNLWIKVTDSPEAPVRKVGRVTFE